MSQANDFFGQDFSSQPAVTQVVEQPKEQPKSLIRGALEFFGLDFAAPVPAPIQKPPVAAPSQFETVFNKLISQESGGSHTDANGKMITSPVGAQGITQVMPKTAVDPGYGVAPVANQSEAEYKRFGKDYLKAMLNEFGNDYEKALAAYNAGAGSVKKAITKAEAAGGNWKDYLPKKSETLPYIKNILGK